MASGRAAATRRAGLTERRVPRLSPATWARRAPAGVSFPVPIRTDRSFRGYLFPICSRSRRVLARRAAACCSRRAIPNSRSTNFTTNEALYRAAMAEFQHGRWDNAIAAFEKLTTDLPARDTLLPRSYWYLAPAHQQQRRVPAGGAELHPPRRELPGRLAGRRRRARGGARRTGSSGASRRSIRRTARAPRRRYNTLIGLYPDVAADRRRRRRRSPSSRSGSRRRTTSPGCTTSAGRRTTRRSSTSRTSSRSTRRRRRRGWRSSGWWTSYKAIQLQGRRAPTPCAAAAHAATRDDAEVEACAVRRGVAPPTGDAGDAPPSTTGHPAAPSGRPRLAEACGSGSSAGASIRRTSATCSP